jgi:predicted RND superfamily exporter protein
VKKFDNYFLFNEKRLATFILEKRLPLLIAISSVTLVFLFFFLRIEISTYFPDLLPQNHPYIKVHNQIRNIFGGSNQLVVMVQVRSGDIFNSTTLEKIKYITEELEGMPGVDKYKILSIASSKMKNLRVTTGQIRIQNVMYPEIPQTQEEIESLRERVYSDERVYGSFVSYDSKKALILADFFEEEIDYQVLFRELGRVRQETEDENHIINVAGEPMHLGYIWSYARYTVYIMVLTALVMLFLFYLYFRSKRAMILPVLASVVSGMWGLGFMALIGFNLDPLMLVLPFLFSAMAASHSVQVVKRYHEETERSRDPEEACKKTIAALFKPGLTGVCTDASAILVIAVIPLKVFQKISFCCVIWSLTTIGIAFILVPILLSYMPLPKKKSEFYGRGLLQRLGNWLGGRGKWYVLAIFILVTLVGYNFARNIYIGDIFPGSSILWPYHRYNKDAFRISLSMPLLTPLYVIVNGEKDNAIGNPGVLRGIQDFQRYMDKMPENRVLFSMSIVNPIPNFYMTMKEGNPHWLYLAYNDDILKYFFQQLLRMGNPGDWDFYIDGSESMANVVLYCREKTADTIEKVISRVKRYTTTNNYKKYFEEAETKILLAGGAIGVQGAINEILKKYQVVTILLSFGIVFLFCGVSFRSVVAGIILTLPLVISNILAFAFMVVNKFTLTTSTLPVSAIGMGLGIDYGIYLVNRIKEESRTSKDLHEGVCRALSTTGMAIFYIATTLVCGIIFWLFSPLMFQAQMGLVLVVLFLLNMIGALLFVPSIIFIFKPRFIFKTQNL